MHNFERTLNSLIFFFFKTFRFQTVFVQAHPTNMFMFSFVVMYIYSSGEYLNNIHTFQSFCTMYLARRTNQTIETVLSQHNYCFVFVVMYTVRRHYVHKGTNNIVPQSHYQCWCVWSYDDKQSKTIIWDFVPYLGYPVMFLYKININCTSLGIGCGICME